MWLLPTIYFTFGSVYMSMPLSHFVPAYAYPSPCPQVHSLHLRLDPVIFNSLLDNQGGLRSLSYSLRPPGGNKSQGCLAQRPSISSKDLSSTDTIWKCLFNLCAYLTLVIYPSSYFFLHCTFCVLACFNYSFSHSFN